MKLFSFFFLFIYSYNYQSSRAFCNQLLQSELCTSNISLLDSGITVNFTSFTIGFWIYINAITMPSSTVEILRFTSDSIDCNADSRRAVFFYDISDKAFYHCFSSASCILNDQNNYYDQCAKFNVDLSTSTPSYIYLYATVKYGLSGTNSTSYFTTVYAPSNIGYLSATDSQYPGNTLSFLYSGNSIVDTQQSIISPTSLITFSYVSKIEHLIFLPDQYMESSEALIRSNIEGDIKFLFKFDEISGNIVYESYNKTTTNQASLSNSNMITCDYSGLEFNGDSVVTLPESVIDDEIGDSSGYGFFMWIRMTEISLCNLTNGLANIFSLNNTNFIIQMGIQPNQQSIEIMLNGITMPEPQISLNLNQWAFLSLAIDASFSQLTILYYTLYFSPPLVDFTRYSGDSGINVNVLLQNSISSFVIGDSLCSFSGNIKNFGITKNSFNFLVNQENCDNTIKLSFGLLYNAPIMYNSCPTGENLDERYYSCDPARLCPQFCNNCDVFGKCNQCQENYYLYLDTSCQFQCNSTLIADTTTNIWTCYQCPVGCSSCNNLSICSLCNSSYRLNVSDNTCSLCPTNCTSCQNAFICNGCTNNSWLQPFGVCSNSCPAYYYQNNQT